MSRCHLKRETKIGEFTKGLIEQQFHLSPKPYSADISILAYVLHLEKKVVRVWFRERRKKANKTKTVATDMYSLGSTPFTNCT